MTSSQHEHVSHKKKPVQCMHSNLPLSCVVVTQSAFDSPRAVLLSLFDLALHVDDPLLEMTLSVFLLASLGLRCSP